MHITFDRATQQYEKIIFEWLSEPHMMEFWDNSQEHKNDILNFIHGRKQHYFAGTTQYFIGLIDDVPFAFLLADILDPAEDLPSPLKNFLSKNGHTVALDFGIGNKDYLGKGLAAPTLESFVKYYNEQIDNQADTFFIDPDENNPRAKHVYEKAGFKHVSEYYPTEGAFIGDKTLLMVKQYKLVLMNEE
ncbi:MAG: GNAT family N-acetyltransferase [Proteobacteria bacterium]|nr:GNAT family N-acetyltransferase [Pseudomonadota bacterium]